MPHQTLRLIKWVNMIVVYVSLCVCDCVQCSLVIALLKRKTNFETILFGGYQAENNPLYKSSSLLCLFALNHLRAFICSHLYYVCACVQFWITVTKSPHSSVSVSCSTVCVRMKTGLFVFLSVDGAPIISMLHCKCVLKWIIYACCSYFKWIHACVLSCECAWTERREQERRTENGRVRCRRIKMTSAKCLH